MNIWRLCDGDGITLQNTASSESAAGRLIPGSLISKLRGTTSHRGARSFRDYAARVFAPQHSLPT